MIKNKELMKNTLIEISAKIGLLDALMPANDEYISLKIIIENMQHSTTRFLGIISQE